MLLFAAQDCYLFEGSCFVTSTVSSAHDFNIHAPFTPLNNLVIDQVARGTISAVIQDLRSSQDLNQLGSAQPAFAPPR